MSSRFLVREFCENDNFDFFNELVWDEHKRRGERLRDRIDGQFSVDYSFKIINKEQYFPEDNSQPINKGFVLESDGDLVAILTATLEIEGKNGTVHKLGFNGKTDISIMPLINACSKFIRDNGGNTMYCFSEILPGQIHNSEVEYWVNLGFKPEPYYSQWVVMNDFTNWQVPDNLQIDRVLPASEMDIVDIINILEEDGERYIAENIRYEFSDMTPEHVFIKLCNVDGQIDGIAYYKVNQDGGTNTLGIHFRPHANDQSYYQEIRRFVRCTLMSLKQLNLKYVGTRMSSRNLLSIIALCAEGFSLAPLGTVVLYRSV
jgi:hypothetical protein